MSNISSLGGFSDPTAHVSSAKSTTARSTTANRTTAAPNSDVDSAESSPIQAQLTRLSSVLQGLQSTSSAGSAHYVQVAQKVRSGTYQIDSQAVSRSILDGSFGH